MKSPFSPIIYFIFISFLLTTSYGMVRKEGSKDNANSQFHMALPKASLKRSYFSDSPNMAAEGNILFPFMYGKHTFFAESHLVDRIAGQQYELNTGLGYRYLVNDNNLIGIYSFFDHNVTQFGNGYNQGTMGGEWFHGKYEVRGNVYVPLSTGQLISVQGLNVHWTQLANGVREGRVGINEVKEIPLYGSDMMAGRHIGSWYLGMGGYLLWKGRIRYGSRSKSKRILINGL